MLRKTLLTVSVLFATAACGQSQTPPPPAAATAPATASAAKLYTVVEGYKVDAETMKGFRTWRAAACDRCHGANQEGMVGPSLIASMKTLTKEEFVKTVRDGRLEKGMQSFGTSPQVMENMNQLYAYLKGRSDGAITRAKVEPMP
jgi:mono/diheme cytochrome c family protein